MDRLYFYNRERKGFYLTSAGEEMKTQSSNKGFFSNLYIENVMQVALIGSENLRLLPLPEREMGAVLSLSGRLNNGLTHLIR